MSYRSEVLSIYKPFVAMVHTQFSMPIRVSCADSAGEYISKMLCGVLAGQGTFARFSCPGAHLLETVTLMIAACLPPHFWTEAIPFTRVHLP